MDGGHNQPFFLLLSLSNNIQNSSSIIDAVNSRGGNLSSTATNTDIANAIKQLDLSVLGNVTYNYHYHSDACPHNVLTWNRVSYDGKTTHCIQIYQCSGGHQYDVSTWTSGSADKSLNGSACPQCGYQCGYTDGQIIGATITY